ncbi:MAG: methyl-accepting chemotaxis protein, partial [Myxococcota bacterium]
MAINTVIIVLGYSVTRIRTKLRAKEIESLESRLEELELVLATQRDVTEGRLDVDRLSGDRDSHAVTRTMVDTLRSLIEHVDGAATRVNLVAGEIEHRSGRQRREAGALAQGVEETLATLVEHSERTQVMVSTARQSEQSADQVREEIEASNAQLHGLRTKLDSVQEQVLAIRGLAAKAEVLALNASLEASRAGEEGKGFRLVATRMRGFSQAVSEASSTVRAVLEEMVGAVLVARDATTRAEAGAAQNNERGRRVADECQVQAESIASLQQVVRGMAELAQKHGDAAEEAAREVGDLREAATHLAGGVTQFLAGRRKSSSPSTASEALPARSVDKPPGQ